MSDEYDLEHFVKAQGEKNYHRALTELQQGKKLSHWIWYVFPQVRGLGQSEISERFGIRSLAEASTYITHPILGERLICCTEATLVHIDLSAETIFGFPDCLKFQSSMTLFEKVSVEGSIFTQVLDIFYGGARDRKTAIALNDIEIGNVDW